MHSTDNVRVLRINPLEQIKKKQKIQPLIGHYNGYNKEKCSAFHLSFSIGDMAVYCSQT